MLFSAVYRFVETARDRRFFIWNSVAQELLTMARLAPLLVSSLRAHHFPRLVAADASDFALGVVSSPASAAELEAIWASRTTLLRDQSPSTSRPRR